MIPVSPGEHERLAVVLSRLTLNKSLFPDHTFEVIICDSGDSGLNREICDTLSKAIPIKYIYVPVGKSISHVYARNVMLRVAEADIIGTINVDHWPSEHLIYGMLNPFIEDSDFRFEEYWEGKLFTSKIKDVYETKLFGQYIEGTIDVLNRGYVVSTKESKLNLDPEKLPSELVMQQYAGVKIHDIFKEAQIPHGKNNNLQAWAIRREHVVALNGYDEECCLSNNDNWHERLQAKADLFDGQNFNFCAINMDDKPCVQSDKKVFFLMANALWPWGRLLEYSFSVINGVYRESEDHEKWIRNTCMDMPNYVESPHWNDIDQLIKELKIHV